MNNFNKINKLIKSASLLQQKYQLFEAKNKYESILKKYKNNLNLDVIEKIFIALGWIHDQIAIKKKVPNRYQVRIKAENYFNRVTQSKNKLNKFQALRGLATICLHQGKFQKALKIYKQALRIKKDGSIHNDLGNIYKIIKDYKKAFIFYKKVIEDKESQSDKDIMSITLLHLIKITKKLNKLNEHKKYLSIIKNFSPQSKLAKIVFNKLSKSNI